MFLIADLFIIFFLFSASKIKLKINFESFDHLCVCVCVYVSKSECESEWGCGCGPCPVGPLCCYFLVGNGMGLPFFNDLLLLLLLACFHLFFIRLLTFHFSHTNCFLLAFLSVFACFELCSILIRKHFGLLCSALLVSFYFLYFPLFPAFSLIRKFFSLGRYIWSQKQCGRRL